MVGIPLDAFTVLENIIKMLPVVYPAWRAEADIPTGVTVMLPEVVEFVAFVGWATMVGSKDKMVSWSNPVLTLLMVTPRGAPGIL
jgi:hypothetical protein